MSECKLDHSNEDVVKKLESQQAFLPADLYEKLQQYLQQDHTQDMLNELFHLLKKYDLSSAEEQEARKKRLMLILNN
ncbi:group-specific protein [Domibacillus epiphyticus]|uniref:Group-specific protein n=1 Tax=Domibacillus epiphyticus TaxID=1714355 RepID=A0A1V2A6J7_9BACI|nr:group-specific protein [Domibacillus epiphyticus]OMP66492.1 group-specific protein [Domibacillus epiphyticus]